MSKLCGDPDDHTALPFLTPSNFSVGKGERYYQQVAIDRIQAGRVKETRT